MDIIEKCMYKCKSPRYKTCFDCSRCGCSHDGKTIEEKSHKKVGKPRRTLSEERPKRPRNDPAMLSYYEPVADYEYEYESDFQYEDISLRSFPSRSKASSSTHNGIIDALSIRKFFNIPISKISSLPSKKDLEETQVFSDMNIGSRN
jgi:hypothetical protein